MHYEQTPLDKLLILVDQITNYIEKEHTNLSTQRPVWDNWIWSNLKLIGKRDWGLSQKQKENLPVKGRRARFCSRGRMDWKSMGMNPLQGIWAVRLKFVKDRRLRYYPKIFSDLFCIKLLPKYIYTTIYFFLIHYIFPYIMSFYRWHNWHKYQNNLFFFYHVITYSLSFWRKFFS